MQEITEMDAQVGHRWVIDLGLRHEGIYRPVAGVVGTTHERAPIEPIDEAVEPPRLRCGRDASGDQRWIGYVVPTVGQVVETKTQ
jgi:hypothetical protein